MASSNATVKIPVKVSWTCSKCGEQNIQSGFYNISGQAATPYGAEKRMKSQMPVEIMAVTQNPKDNITIIGKGLKLNNKGCKNCHHKEKWQNNYFVIYSLIMTVPSFLISFTIFDDFTKAFLAGMALSIVFDIIGTNIVSRIKISVPEESLPRIILAQNEGVDSGKKCAHCGKKLKPDSEFCPFCGKKL